MRIREIIGFFIAIALVLTISCSKAIVPASGLKPGSNGFDSAAFDYVFVEAIKLKMIGNLGESLKYFEQCIRINPASDATYYQMAQIIFSTGDVNSGRKYLLKAIEYAPYNKWYPVMMAGTYYQTGNLDSAIYFYEKAVKNSPEKEEIQLTLGNLYSENKEFEKASRIFDDLDRKYGINETSTLASVKNYLLAGKYQEAFERIEKLISENPEEVLYYGLLAETYQGLGDKDKAMEVYTDLLEKSPGNPGALLSLCNFLLKEKNYEELLGIINQVILNKGISRDEKVSLFSQMIENKDLMSRYNQPVQVSCMVLEAQYPGDNIIQIIRPEVLISGKDYTSAISLLEKITDENKGNYYAWEKLLLAYMEVRDFKSLQSKSEICASLFNRSFLAKVLYATGATENKDYATALAELEKARILAGSDNDMLIQVLSLKADIYYRMNDLDKAFQTFEEALVINKDDLTVLNNYAYYLAEKNSKLKEAESMARQVIQTEKNNSTFLDTYAWVLYKRGKTREAMRIMEQIINGGSEPDADLYEHYGFILKKRNDCSKAIEAWNTALKIDSTKTELIKEISNCKK